MLKRVSDVLQTAEIAIRYGDTVFFKFTCVGCGTRQTFTDPNKFYFSGKCELCGIVTDLANDARADVNYMRITIGGSIL